jgi:exosortase family protein XrtF
VLIVLFQERMTLNNLALLKEFKPSLLFLARFLGIYFVGNILYGLYVESYDNTPDGITYSVTVQVTAALNLLGCSVTASRNTQGPTVFIETTEKIILSVYEGCNGVNVMILFVAFIVAFGGPRKKMGWFASAGLLIVHLCNLLRIVMLFFVAEYYDRYFYYVHKYAFTAVIYIVVFILWVIWVAHFNKRAAKDKSS